jgi:coupling of ubiquitin conjugation to ER degradation protein 1
MSSRASGGDGSSRRNGQRFTPAQVEQITQMFPQLNRRDIMWDLQRNGGSVAATTERILGGRGLEPVRSTARPCSSSNLLASRQAPPSFQPQVPLPALSSTSITTSAMRKTVEPDLITRYNLQSKISSKGKEKAEDSPPIGWAPSKDLRQQMLQRRRDGMILAARRRMQEKDEGSAGT